MQTKDEIIKKLNLIPHPKEGGYFIETYRADEYVPQKALPTRYISEKAYSTAIYYLLTPDTFSAIHKLSSDEIFHFYLGDPVTAVHLFPDGSLKKYTLGHDILNGQTVQLLAPKDTWQGAYLNEGGDYALLGTTVAPAFDYQDYLTGDREELIKLYPEHTEIIKRLTPP